MTVTTWHGCHDRESAAGKPALNATDTKSVKYEEVYLRAYDAVSECRASLGRYFDFYNAGRPHSRLDRATPDQVYFESVPLAEAA